MKIVVEIEKMIIIILMITCVFIRNMLALIIMIVSMTTCLIFHHLFRVVW